jgi:mono/diheme cytochrome c family protein
MSDYLSAAADAMGTPEALVKRSAAARASATGVSVEDILAAWAGGNAAPPATSAPPLPEPIAEQAAPAPVESVAPATDQSESPKPEPAAEPRVQPRVIPARPVPDTVGIEEAREWESVITVPTAGLKERTKTRIPSWLTAAFVILPLVGLLYLLQLSNGPACGESGLLAVDRASGEVVNCDGSPFEGRGAPGGGSTDSLARGQALYADAQVACKACHGDNGQGGVGPTFAGGAVLATFPACADHVKWVQLGSAGWQAQVGPEYGAQGKVSQGGMPGFGDSLSDEDLRSVITFERVRFGGADLNETLVDCGLAIPEPPADESGTVPADGTDGTTTTTSG